MGLPTAGIRAVGAVLGAWRCLVAGFGSANRCRFCRGCRRVCACVGKQPIAKLAEEPLSPPVVEKTLCAFLGAEVAVIVICCED